MTRQVTGDFAALVSEVEAAWSNLFPQRLGYCTRAQLISDQVVRLEVRRGDFEGQVELCCDFDGPEAEAGRIRAVASTRSQRGLRSKKLDTPPGYRSASFVQLLLGAKAGQLADDARADAAFEWMEAVAAGKEHRVRWIRLRTTVTILFNALLYVASRPLALINEIKKVMPRE